MAANGNGRSRTPEIVGIPQDPETNNVFLNVERLYSKDERYLRAV
jgi:hypothetical protein